MKIVIKNRKYSFQNLERNKPTPIFASKSGPVAQWIRASHYG